MGNYLLVQYSNCTNVAITILFACWS